MVCEACEQGDKPIRKRRAPMVGNCPVCREIGKPDGSCSPWCRDVVEVERERDAARRWAAAWKTYARRLSDVIEYYKKVLAEVEDDRKEMAEDLRHLRRGIEAYREYINTQNPYPMMKWEREEAARDSD